MARASSRIRRSAVGLALVALGGCGLGLTDDTSGGRDHLPAAGAGPFRRLAFDADTPLEEPLLAADRIIDFDEPAVLAAPGGGFRYWLSREPADLPLGDTEIWAGALTALTAAPSGPAPALVADQAWEQGRVAAPAVVVDPGDRRHLTMFYEGGLAAPQIGRADSFDDGATWQKHGAPVLAAASSPGAAWDGVDWLLAIERPAAPGIWLARSRDGLTFTVDDAPVITARADIADAFDAVAVGQPALGWIEQGTGRGLWTLWFAGTDEPVPVDDTPRRFAIGYAASFDAVAWQRSAGLRPILSAPAGAPAVALAERDILLYGAPSSRRRAVGIAIH